MKTVALLYDARLDFGGVEQHLLGLLRYANPFRFRFVIFSDCSQDFLNQANALGARVVNFTHWRMTDNQIVPQLSAAFRAASIDLVHAHSPTASASGRWAARQLNIPALVTVHLPVTQYHGELHTLRASLGRFYYTALDRWLNFTHPAPLIYVSQAVRDACVKQHHSPASHSLVIPNGIDLPAFQGGPGKAGQRSKLGVPAEARVLIFHGRLQQQKSLDVLLDAIAIIRKDIPDLNLWLVGDGPQRAQLEQQALQLRLGDSVRFWGIQHNVVDFLSAADCFTLPSHSEALPMALLEALAAGLPCVVTDVGDNPLLVRDGIEGKVVPVRNAPALAVAIMIVLADSNLRHQMGENARERSLSFSQQSMVEKIQNLYETLLTQAI